MAPGPIVEHFNVIEDIRPGQIPGFIYAFSDPFFFQRTEERFGHRIIPAVATPAHARRQVIGPVEALPVVTAVLTTLTQPQTEHVEDHSCRSHLEGSRFSSPLLPVST